MPRLLALLFASVLIAACGQSGDLYLPGSGEAPKAVSDIGAPSGEDGEDDTDAASDDEADDKDNDDDAERRSDDND